ncbi:hypothetical protein MSAN_01061800 [Mycena sanguinolenta]|uniref:Uncharacterized protein n=1 Tax=Mycena sanguinolenta TaxID=230812 RepID=A0A8H7D9V4_9AGAR|nr:hypothetical protein MSAN_01061800 [Mycena sanguinolenta]
MSEFDATGKFSEVSPHWYVQRQDVQVPQVKFNALSWREAITQRLLCFLAPTTSRVYTDKNLYFHDRFADQVREYSTTRKQIKQLFLVCRSQRLSQLHEIRHRLGLPEPPTQWDREVDHVQRFLEVADRDAPVSAALVKESRAYKVMQPALDLSAEHELSVKDIELLDQYCESIKRTRMLKSHLAEIEEDLDNYAYLLHTQATAELTCFRGFRDWCQVMSQLTNGLSNSLIGISTLGAGLVYSTVFGATRGDVGLMCYCFPFFSCGFLLPVVIQIILQSGASLQAEFRFASQQFWTIVLAICLSISTLAVAASLTILNLTVFFLKSDPDDPIPDPPDTPAPGIIAFGFTGAVFVLILTGVLLTIAARAFTTLKGIRAIVADMYGSTTNHRDALQHWLPV